MTKLFFATDVHGSDKCWKKFISAGKFYGADVLILGGDMTGKAIVPILKRSADYQVTFLEQAHILYSEAEVEQMEEMIRNRGYYPVRMEADRVAELENKPEEVGALFNQQAMARIKEWLSYADDKLQDSGIKCFVCPGNDDMFEIDKVFKQSLFVEIAEGKVVNLDENWQMISTGWSNSTPWNTNRECTEKEMEAKIEGMAKQVKDMSKTIFNFHCPPYNSGLDEAPELDQDLRPKYAGRSLIPVGSTAVKKAIEDYRPAVGLFGHIHEAKGAKKIKKSICINPGSSYEQGVLMGALVQFNHKTVRNYVLTTG